MDVPQRMMEVEGMQGAQKGVSERLDAVGRRSWYGQGDGGREL